MTILRRFHIEYPGTTAWVDITSRVIGDVQWTEGRNLSLLGGPLPPAVPATLQCTLGNATGYFTKGAGSALGPGARFRLQWRATTGDAWVTRYVGRLSEQRVRFRGSSRIAVRWYGALIHITGSELAGRTYGNRTANVIMGEICDTAGVAMADRDFDTTTDTFAITTPGGYPGVIQFVDLVGGFLYDTPDGKVRLELGPTRTAKAVSASYTDVAATGTEIEIAPPEVLTNPFGIVNQVDGELRVYSPATGDDTLTFPFPTQNSIVGEWPGWRRLTLNLPLGFLASDGVMNTGFIFQIVPSDIGTTLQVSSETNNADGLDLFNTGIWERLFQAGNVYTFIEFRNWSIVAVGDTLTWTFEYRGWSKLGSSPPATWGPTRLITRMGSMFAYIRDLYAVLQHTETYPYAEANAESQTLHGIKRRMSPLVVSQFVADITSFTPDLTSLEERVGRELELYSNAHEAHIVETTAATVAERASLLARRLSDKVHLTLSGRSQLSVDADFFVEAIQTTLTPQGNVTQLLHVVEGPPPEAPTDAPTGFTVTRNSAARATLAWDSGTIAAARFNIYRGDAANNLTLLRGDFGDGATVEYIDNTISSPNEYWYAVAAENNGGEGPQTAAARAGWPQQPTGFQVFRLDNMSLLLFWDNPNDSGITGYRIWRGTSSGNINTQIENSVGSASTTQYTDDGLTDNQEYWYQIQALYGVIASVRSDSASAIP